MNILKEIKFKFMKNFKIKQIWVKFRTSFLGH
jgi:hypothetical protein